MALTASSKRLPGGWPVLSLPPLVFAFVLAAFVLAPATAAAEPGPCSVPASHGNPVEVELQTSAGWIALELWPDVAPCTVENFLAYVESGRYDGTFIHRTADAFVVQGGGYAYDAPSDTFTRIPRDAPVVNEPGASNLRGTIAMARQGGVVDSATSEFFINLSDNTFLDSVDEGFTVFGEVVGGDMAVVDAIATLPRLVGRWSLESELRETFSELPVHALPTEPPGGYGCFDPDATPVLGTSGWLRALVNQAQTALEPDPLTGAAYFLSATCTGAGATGPPSVACSGSRTVAYSNGSGYFVDPNPMPCAAIAESEESLAARRSHQQPQVGADLVELEAVFLPEPTTGPALVAGALALLALDRRRRRHAA